MSSDTPIYDALRAQYRERGMAVPGKLPKRRPRHAATSPPAEREEPRDWFTPAAPATPADAPAVPGGTAEEFPYVDTAPTTAFPRVPAGSSAEYAAIVERRRIDDARQAEAGAPAGELVWGHATQRGRRHER